MKCYEHAGKLLNCNLGEFFKKAVYAVVWFVINTTRTALCMLCQPNVNGV